MTCKSHNQTQHLKLATTRLRAVNETPQRNKNAALNATDKSTGGINCGAAYSGKVNGKSGGAL